MVYKKGVAIKLVPRSYSAIVLLDTFKIFASLSWVILFSFLRFLNLSPERTLLIFFLINMMRIFD